MMTSKTEPRSPAGSVSIFFRSILALSFAAIPLGCVPNQGGWDLPTLLESEPALEANKGHRLGDMLPFPVFVGDRVEFVSCRYPDGHRISIAGAGAGWSDPWARAAVSSLDAAVRNLDLELVTNKKTGRQAEIEIHSINQATDEGPKGLGDTFTECDITPRRHDGDLIRGILVRSEIRMRRERLDMVGQLREASAEEWVGALMHELGHALGFSGHAATGDSILVREQNRIRLAGRRALNQEPWRDATIEALYQLQPGKILGHRVLKQTDLALVQKLHERIEQASSRGAGETSSFSSVGDREARIRWQLPDGSQLNVRFPFWQKELRAGLSLTLTFDQETRRLLIEPDGN